MPARAQHDPALLARIGGNAQDGRHMLCRTLASVSAEVGISESMLSKIENGRACPSVPTLVKLAGALGLGIDELCSDAAAVGEAA